mmetsp:Transcript_17579/g.52802  ORF Transcript_17579/g.52802 Transcript_17579/m.52802 type:complete len:1028 (-) Transcript_17579:267-3350(-)
MTQLVDTGDGSTASGAAASWKGSTNTPSQLGGKKVLSLTASSSNSNITSLTSRSDLKPHHSSDPAQLDGSSHKEQIHESSYLRAMSLDAGDFDQKELPYAEQNSSQHLFPDRGSCPTVKSKHAVPSQLHKRPESVAANSVAAFPRVQQNCVEGGAHADGCSQTEAESEPPCSSSGATTESAAYGKRAADPLTAVRAGAPSSAAWLSSLTEGQAPREVPVPGTEETVSQALLRLCSVLPAASWALGSRLLSLLSQSAATLAVSEPAATLGALPAQLLAGARGHNFILAFAGDDDSSGSSDGQSRDHPSGSTGAGGIAHSAAGLISASSRLSARGLEAAAELVSAPSGEAAWLAAAAALKTTCLAPEPVLGVSQANPLVSRVQTAVLAVAAAVVLRYALGGTRSQQPHRAKRAAVTGPSIGVRSGALGWDMAAPGRTAAPAKNRGFVKRLFAGTAAAELSFQALQSFRFPACNELGAHPPSMEASEQAMEAFFRLHGVIDIGDFLSGWFQGAPLESIRRDNMLDFVAGAIFCRPPGQLPAPQRTACISFISRMERVWGIRFEAGRSAGVRPMLHLWEPLAVVPKPLVVHAVAELCGALTRRHLHHQGYTPTVNTGFTFWLRPPLCAPPAPPAPPSAAAIAAARPPRISDVSSASFASWARSRATANVNGAAAETDTGIAAPIAGEVASQTVTRSASDESSINSTAGSGDPLSDAERPAEVFGGSSLISTTAPEADDAAAACLSMTAAAPALNAAIMGESTRETQCRAGSGTEDVHAAEAAGTAASHTGPRPLVFVHGVGWGLQPYLGFLASLAAAAPHHPVITVEFRHVSLRMGPAKPPLVDEVAHAVASAVTAAGYQDACFVAHSYGTFVVSRLCQLYPQMVHSMALLDPVCLMTCAPQLLSNFVYRLPPMRWRQLASTPDAAMDAARIVACRDLLIAASFCRSFHWHELMLWPEDMAGAPSLVVLSARDDLVPFDLVRAQLAASKECGVEVVVHPTAGHGGFLVDEAFQRRLAQNVARLVAAAEGQL